MTPQLGDHFFRQEYGRLVAMLSRRVGLGHLESVEDSVQCALLAAVESWPRVGLPENPSAWLFRVAHNHVIGELRQRARRERSPPWAPKRAMRRRGPGSCPSPARRPA